MHCPESFILHSIISSSLKDKNAQSWQYVKNILQYIWPKFFGILYFKGTFYYWGKQNRNLKVLFFIAFLPWGQKRTSMAKHSPTHTHIQVNRRFSVLWKLSEQLWSDPFFDRAEGGMARTCLTVTDLFTHPQVVNNHKKVASSFSFFFSPLFIVLLLTDRRCTLWSDLGTPLLKISTIINPPLCCRHSDSEDPQAFTFPAAPALSLTFYNLTLTHFTFLRKWDMWQTRNHFQPCRPSKPLSPMCTSIPPSLPEGFQKLLN